MVNIIGTNLTLDQALEMVARRSFYESCLVQKQPNGLYLVESHYTGVEESQNWEYETGIDTSGITHLIDESRLMEAYESFTESNHIRYHEPVAVAMLKEGHGIGFTYIVADELCQGEGSDDENCNHPDGCQTDHTAGWALVATLEIVIEIEAETI